MATELAERPNIDAMAQFSPDKVELLKRTICRGATNDELDLFIHACNRMGLDPFMKQIHAVKRRQQNDAGEYVEVMAIQTGIDGYRLIADRTGRYMPGREPTYSYNDKGELVAATAYVKKMDRNGQWHELSDSALWDEYVAAKRDGSPTKMWASKPHIMLAKCAEAKALRRAFPAELSGVYTAEEMQQADNPPLDNPRTVKVSRVATAPPAADERPQLPPADDVPVIDRSDPLADDDVWREELDRAFQSRGFHPPQADKCIADVMAKKGGKSITDLSLADRHGFIDYVTSGGADKYRALPKGK